MGSRGGGHRRSGRRHAAGRRGGRARVPVQPGRTHLRDARHVHARGGEPRRRVHRRRLHRVPAAPGAISHSDRRSAQRARDAAASRLSGQARRGPRARVRGDRPTRHDRARTGLPLRIVSAVDHAVPRRRRRLRQLRVADRAPDRQRHAWRRRQRDDVGTDVAHRRRAQPAGAHGRRGCGRSLTRRCADRIAVTRGDGGAD